MTPQDLRTAITRGQLGGCYLLTGEEEYLKRYYRDEVRRTLLTDPAFETFDHVVFDGEDVSLADLSEAVKGMPMFAPKRLVEWNHAPWGDLKPQAREYLLDIAREAGEEGGGTVLLVLVENAAFDPGTPKRPSEDRKKWEEVASVVFFDKNTDAQLAAWIGRHFAREGLGADGEVCHRMVDRCGHAMEDLAHEIDKVCCFVGGHGRTAVTVGDIDAVCCVNLENDTFGLTNALLDGRAPDAFACLDEMRSRRVEPQLVMGQLSRFWCDLAAVAALLDEGKNPGAVASLLKMNEYKAGLYARAAKRMGSAWIKASLAACRRADLTMKSVFAEPWGQIAKLLVKIVK